MICERMIRGPPSVETSYFSKSSPIYLTALPYCLHPDSSNRRLVPPEVSSFLASITPHPLQESAGPLEDESHP